MAWADALADGRHDTATVASVLERAPSVSVSQSLDSALDVLDGSRETAIPVVDEESVVGWLTHQRVLAAMRTEPQPS